MRVVSLKQLAKEKEEAKRLAEMSDSEDDDEDEQEEASSPTSPFCSDPYTYFSNEKFKVYKDSSPEPSEMDDVRI